MTTFDLKKLDDLDFSKLPDQDISSEDQIVPDNPPVREVVNEALKVNSDEQVRINNLSQQSGFAPEFVREAPDDVEANIKLDSLVPIGLEQSHPVTASFLSVFDNAVVAAEDSLPLREIEDYLNEPQARTISDIANDELKRRGKSDLVNNIQGGSSRAVNLLGSTFSFVEEAGQSLADKFDFLGGGVSFVDPDDGSFGIHFLNKEEFQSRPDLNFFARGVESFKQTDFGFEQRGTAAGVLEAAENGTLSEFVSTAVSTAIETTSRSLPDMIGAAYALPVYIAARSNELGDERAVNKGLVEKTFTETVEAVPGAIASSLLERILPNKIFKTKTSDELKEIGNTVLDKVSNVAVRTVEGVVIEAGTEFVQEGVIEYLTEKVGTDAELDIRKALSRGVEGAILGGLSGGVLSGGVTTVQEAVTPLKSSDIIAESKDKLLSKVLKQAEDIETKSDQETQTAERLNQTVSNLKLNQRSPETLQEFVKQADKNNNSQLFIDGAQARLYLQDKDITSDLVLRSLNDLVTDAALTGGDIAIPINEAVGILGNDEHFIALKDSITLTPDGVPQFRKEQAIEETRNHANRVVAEATEVQSRYIEAQSIAETVRDQLIDSGRVSPEKATIAAQIAPAWAAAYAEREGITVKEAFDRSGLTITGPLTGEKAKLHERRSDLEGRKLKQEKGSIKGTFDPVRSIIELTEASDLSTFLHEFGHFIYEQELNAQSESSKENIKAIHDWVKRDIKQVVKAANKRGDKITEENIIAYIDQDTTGDLLLDDGVRVAIHEQVAEGFEQYLLEGKAPSVELRNAFASFARWLGQIYRGVQNALSINLDDDARLIFDRLVATEEQIEAAEARAQYEPKITDAVLAGMTEEQFAEYKKNKDRVKDKQSETLRDKLLAAIRNRIKNEQSERFKSLVSEEETKLADDTTYRAINALKTGKIKLDLAAAKAELGEETTTTTGVKKFGLPPRFRNLTISGKRGIHHDQAAEFFGFTSGRELLETIRDTIPLKEQAELNAKQRLREEVGDPLNDGTVEAEADEAIRVDGRGELLLQELAALRRQSNEAVIKREEIKQIAEYAIGKLNYSKIHPHKYRAAELRAAQDVARAEAQGNLTLAAEAKSRQVLNYYLGVSATNARRDIEKTVDFTARYRKKSVREAIQKAGEDTQYWEQITKILDRFEFRKSASIKSTEVKSLESWSQERQNEHGDIHVITHYVLNETNKTHWKNVPFNELQGVKDSLTNIEHTARQSNKIRIEGEEIDFQEAVETALNSIALHNKPREKFKNNKRSTVFGIDLLRQAAASLTKIPYLTTWLDGGERGGTFHNMTSQKMTDAQEQMLELWGDVAEPVVDLIKNRSKEDIRRHNQTVTLDSWGTDNKIYIHQIIAVALNTGNQQNLEKLMIGEGWVDASEYNQGTITRDNPQLNEAFQHLTKSDWEMIQTIWDQMDKLYKPLADVTVKATGVKPPKVPSLKFTNEHGTFEGGYYPLTPDPKRSDRAEQNVERLEELVDSQFGTFTNISATVNAGSTNQRTDAFYPIKMNLDVVAQHFNETIHYISHYQAVKETFKLVNNKEIKRSITERLGVDEYNLFKPWIKDIASQGRESESKNFVDALLTRLKTGTTLGVMGFNATTGVVQLLGLSNAAAEVGAINLARGFKHVLGAGEQSRKDAFEYAMEKSKILKNRVKTMDREMQNALREIQGRQSIKSGRKIQDILSAIDNNPALRKVQELSMMHIGYIQLYAVDLPTWYGAYMKELRESGDEDKAHSVADWTVENIQGSGSMKDTAALLRSTRGTTQILTMFMTFFSAAWNFQRDTIKGAANGSLSKIEIANRITFGLIVPVLAEEYLRSLITGGLTDDDEDNDPKAQELAVKTLMYPVTGIPFVRDVASFATSDFGYSISPVQSLIEQSLNSTSGLIEAIASEDEDVTTSDVLGTLKFTGLIFKIPGTGGIKKAANETIESLVDGEEFMWNQALFGEPPRN